jgi:hypothetical protein
MGAIVETRPAARADLYAGARVVLRQGTGSPLLEVSLATGETPRYLQFLDAGMIFQEMAVELGWTYHQVVEFGGHFLLW